MKNYKVAVTGGIGSGKSTFCGILKKLGYPVFSCDEIYKNLLTDEEVVKQVSKIVGVQPITTKNGFLLAKNEVSSIIFSNKSKRAELEKYTHPLIMSELMLQADKVGGITFSEVPLLFEGNYDKLFDKVVIIMRNEHERIKSVCLRDKTTEENVVNRIKNQFSYENIENNGHTVIYNDGNLLSLELKTVSLLDEIKKEIN